VEGRPPANYVASQGEEGLAVVIGIDEYRHVPQLGYAVADARSMAEVFIQHQWLEQPKHGRDHQVCTLALDFRDETEA